MAGKAAATFRPCELAVGMRGAALLHSDLPENCQCAPARYCELATHLSRRAQLLSLLRPMDRGNGVALELVELRDREDGLVSVPRRARDARVASAAAQRFLHPRSEPLRRLRALSYIARRILRQNCEALNSSSGNKTS